MQQHLWQTPKLDTPTGMELQETDMWDKARRELDCWAEAGLTARFWVRDDDACQASENLERLRDLAARHDIRIGLAVIPGKIAPDLCEYLGRSVLQFYPMCHGWKHINYNRRNKPAEFGPDRPISSMIVDAKSALDLFKEHFGTSKAIFVPPFNAITPGLVRALPNIGFFGISLVPPFLENKMLQLVSRLNRKAVVKLPASSRGPRIDVHLDVINWKTRTAQDTKTIANQLLQQLRGRRLGLLAADTPIGLLTHHLAHDEPIWRTCDEVLRVLQSHKAVEFIDVGRWADEYPQMYATPVTTQAGLRVS
ncbi:hypothetical protein V1283_000730 [Bradyrhizobium sp. AZCC 2262]|uniref:hypothetical protein n=1 Tax=Bradyrhizobium sp. AZCC 2262 TaxID=3117022 RepID=UPI002FEE79F8